MAVILAFIFLSLTQIALGQDAAPVVPPDMWIERGFLDSILDPTFFAKITALAIAVQVLLRGVAEGLTKISELTENKTDNKIAYWTSEAAWLLGSLLGKFGYGEPKAVTAEKIAQAKEK